MAHEGDPSGKSKGSWHTFSLNDGSGMIYLECMDWAEHTGKWDNLRVTIFNEKFSKFLSTKLIRLNIKIFICVLILALNFNSFSKADDISEFEIEGLSIGYSLLNKYSKKEIEDLYKASYL